MLRRSSSVLIPLWLSLVWTGCGPATPPTATDRAASTVRPSSAGRYATSGAGALTEPASSPPLATARQALSAFVGGEWLEDWLWVGMNDAMHHRDADPWQDNGLLQSLLEYLGGAEGTIDAALFNPEQLEVAAALAERAGAGVQVRVICDDEFCDPCLDDDPATQNASCPAIELLQGAGIPVLSDGCSPTHRQMANSYLVVDGEWVWTGSFDTTAAGRYLNNENAVRLRSAEVAGRFRTDFEAMWASAGAGPPGCFFNTQKPDDPSPPCQLVAGHEVCAFFNPREEREAEDAIRAALATAQHSAHVALFTFWDKQLAQQLLDLHTAGVEVQVLCNSVHPSHECRWLLDQGVPVKYHTDVETQAELMHHKFAVVDAGHPESDPIVITGSASWANGWLDKNDGNTLLVHHAGLARVFEAEFRELYDGWAHCPSLAHQLIEQGLEFLRTRRQVVGGGADRRCYWKYRPAGTDGRGATTGLALLAFVNRPGVDPFAAEQDLVCAIEYLLGLQKPESGAIASGGGDVYETTGAVLGLLAVWHAAETHGWTGDYRNRIAAALDRAHEFLVASQRLAPEIWNSPDPITRMQYGGWNYAAGPSEDDNEWRTDMSNTQFGVWGLKALEHAHPQRWPFPIEAQVAADNYTMHSMNSDGDDVAGCRYGPAWREEGYPNDGRSYGSITAGCLWSSWCTNQSPQVNHVQWLRNWLRLHYTADRNPQFDTPAAWYYYYLHTAARAWSMYGIDDSNHGKDWYCLSPSDEHYGETFVAQLRASQQADGSWPQRYDAEPPVLATEHATLALEIRRPQNRWPTDTLRVLLASPARLALRDPRGNVVGWVGGADCRNLRPDQLALWPAEDEPGDAGEELVPLSRQHIDPCFREEFTATYTRDPGPGPDHLPQEITVPAPEQGHYEILLWGEGDGHYRLTVEQLRAQQQADGTVAVKTLTTQQLTESITPGERRDFPVVAGSALGTPTIEAQLPAVLGGRILLPDAADHAGTRVLLWETGQAVQTAADGTFSFGELALGPYWLSVLQDGYRTVTQELQFQGSAVVELTLEPVPTVVVEPGRDELAAAVAGAAEGTLLLLRPGLHRTHSVVLKPGQQLVGGGRPGELPTVEPLNADAPLIVAAADTQVRGLRLRGAETALFVPPDALRVLLEGLLFTGNREAALYIAGQSLRALHAGQTWDQGNVAFLVADCTFVGNQGGPNQTAQALQGEQAIGGFIVNSLFASNDEALRFRVGGAPQARQPRTTLRHNLYAPEERFWGIDPAADDRQVPLLLLPGLDGQNLCPAPGGPWGRSPAVDQGLDEAWRAPTRRIPGERPEIGHCQLPAMTLRGQVTDATGTPLPGCQALLTGGLAPLPLPLDAEGRFELTPLAVGRFGLEVRCPPLDECVQLQPISRTVEGYGEDVALLCALAPEARRLNGRVFSRFTPDGLASCSVLVDGQPWALTGDHGQFAGSLPAGEHQWQVQCPCHRPFGPEPVTMCEDGGLFLDVSSALPTLTGQLVDRSARTPLAGCRVTLAGLGRAPVVTGEDGRFTLAQAPTGAQRIEASCPDHEAAGQPVHICGDTQVELDAARLAPGYTVAVTLQDEAGAARSGCRVVLDGPTDGVGLTDETGHCTLTGVASGTYQVQATCAGCASHQEELRVEGDLAVSRQVRCTCQPGQAEACGCSEGQAGEHFCTEAGEWSACDCPPDPTEPPFGATQPCDCPAGRQGSQRSLGSGLWDRCECPICDPGEVRTCACPEDRSGTQVCTGDGQRWEACACPTPQVCSPLTDQACQCPVGEAQGRRCALDGRSYETCSCPNLPAADDGDSDGCSLSRAPGSASPWLGLLLLLLLLKKNQE